MTDLSKYTENDPGSTEAAYAPLQSWDVFLDTYYRIMQLLDDAQSIYNLGKQYNWKHKWDFRKILLEENKVILVTQKDLSIVYASSNMIEMTGYPAEEIIGKTPRLFQGAGTQAEGRRLIRNAIQSTQPFEATLVNYTKSGRSYDCHIEGFPVFNNQRELSHFIAFENAV